MKLTIALLSVALGASIAAAADRPNILFILADDVGQEWLSCYGGEHKTPNLDSLAAGGVRFETAWATPLCTPTRHELLTGRYPFRTGWTTHWDTPRWGGQYFDWNREVTFARMLRDAGYATAIAGKWQINDLRAQPDALDRHGFDEHCVWPGVEAGNPQSEARYFDPFMQINGKRGIQKGRFGPDVCREFLIDFMKRNRSQPFLAYYPMLLAHSPMTKTPHNLDTGAKGAALFPGMIDYIDFEVGDLVKALDDLKLREKTIVFFAGDNGSPGVTVRMKGREVTGGKNKLTEAGICMPFLVNGPGRILAGRTTDELIDFSDVFPTLAELTGSKLPKGVILDGRSFVSFITDKPRTGPARAWIYSQYGPARVIRDKRYKLYSDGRFYDLQMDPGERFDLADSDNPDVITSSQRLMKVLKSLPADARLPFEPRKPPEPERKGRRERANETPMGEVKDPGDLR